MNKCSAKEKNNTVSAIAIIRDGCCFYAAITVAMLLVTVLIEALADDVSGSGIGIAPLQMLLLFPFGLFAASARTVRRASHLSAATKGILHPSLTLGGFFLCVYLPYQIDTKPTGAQILMILLLVILVYAVAVIIYLPVAAARRRKREEEKPYTSQFSKRK